ncbi:hypothetical protein TYRP_008920 [Tyrophagus putrescentiae]|nr:hypothetical protein TYRP_008920 [Tyrophagus putrescentiae]
MAMPTLHHLLQRTLTLLTPTVFCQSARPAIENRFVLFAPRLRLCWTMSRRRPSSKKRKSLVPAPSKTRSASSGGCTSFLSRLALRKIYLIRTNASCCGTCSGRSTTPSPPPSSSPTSPSLKRR